jgi:hypothetical protein
LDTTGNETSHELRGDWMLTRAQTDMIVQKNRRNKEEDTVSVHVQNKNKSDDILDSFRTKDVRDLAKSLSKDKTVKEKNGTNSTFVPGVNVYYSKKK